MIIRAEQETDLDAIYAINASAFETRAEADLVNALRENVQSIVSLLADDDGHIIGHIMLSPVVLSGNSEINIMGLAPMAVSPDYQRRGIGSALVRSGLEHCMQLGHESVVVLGHPDYYPCFGFTSASNFGIDSKYDVPDDLFMAIELQPGALDDVSGTVKYHPAFSSV